MATKKSSSKKVVKVVFWKRWFIAIRTKISGFMARRPHRSFRRTRRRDYVRSLQLPGFFAFTGYVAKVLWRHKTTFLLLALIYAVLSGLFVGLASQNTFTTLASTLKNTSSDLFGGGWGQIGQAGLLTLATFGGALNSNLTTDEQIYAALFALMVWLTTVWLLRSIMADKKVRLRDGLYNAGAPLLATVIVFIVMLVQLLPIALALIGYNAANSSGLLAGGVEAMLFWLAAGGLALLSLFWITSSFFALVIVTIPGMYPFTALSRAGDLVTSRRFRLLLRILWLLLTILVAWAVVLILVTLFDTWLNGVWPAFSSVPLVPVIIVVLASLSIIWASSYVYLLYRKVVDDNASPA